MLHFAVCSPCLSPNYFYLNVILYRTHIYVYIYISYIIVMILYSYIYIYIKIKLKWILCKNVQSIKCEVSKTHKCWCDFSVKSRIRASLNPKPTDSSFAITGTRQPEQHGSWWHPHPSRASPEPLQDRSWLSCSAQRCSHAISQLIDVIINTNLVFTECQVCIIVHLQHSCKSRKFTYQYVTLQNLFLVN